MAGVAASPSPDQAVTRAPLVLWACGNADDTVPLAGGAFTLHVLVERRVEPLRRALRALQPDVLVVDADWCHGTPRLTLERMRRAAPGARWIFSWHEVTWPAVALLLELDGRAAVHHGAPPKVWADAVTAVFAGRMWLPRSAERWLYVKAQAARRRELRQADAMPLTAREVEVRGLLELGFTNKEIARELQISSNTVKKHVTAVLDKGGLRSRRQVVAR